MTHLVTLESFISSGGEKHSYLFRGAVHPISAMVNIPEYRGLGYCATYNGLQECIMILNVTNSSILLEFVIDSAVLDLPTLINTAHFYIEGIVSCLSFSDGCSYSTELQTVALVVEGLVVNITVDVPDLVNKSKKLELDDLVRAATMDQAFFLRPSLRDFARAMGDASDTGFLCYRAIERIRKYYSRRDSVKPSRGWTILKSELNVDAGKLNAIKALGDLERHGQLVLMSPVERSEIFVSTHEIIERFASAILCAPTPSVDIPNLSAFLLSRKEI